MKYIKFTIAIILYTVLLLTIYYLHIAYLKVGVVFYSSLIDAVVASLLTLICVILIKWFRVFTVFERTQLFFIWLLIGYGFAISVPTVIDRSLSFYILEKLQQRDGGIKLDSFDLVFTKEYIKEHRLIDVRLTEQQESGTIVIKNGCVKLTDWGSLIATSSRFFRLHFLPSQRLLLGQYTDVLTDPFKHSLEVQDYKCK